MACITYRRRLKAVIAFEMRLLRMIAALAGCVAFAFVVYATLSPISLRPIVTTPHFEHFAAYGVVAGLFALAFPRNRLAILVSILVLAGGLELAQLGISGRHGRFEDFFVKAAGITAGVAVASAARRVLPYSR